MLSSWISGFFQTAFGQFIAQQNVIFLLPEIILLITLSFGLFQSMSDNKDKQLKAWRTSILGCFFALITLSGLLFNLFLNPEVAISDGFTFPVLYDMFRADLFSTVMRLTVLLGTFLVLLFSKTYMAQKSPVPAEGFLLMIGSTIGALLITGANDLIMAFVGLETLGISSFILAGYLRNQFKSAEASLKYLLYGGTSTAVLLFGFSLLMGLGGGYTHFEPLSLYLQASDLSMMNPVIPLMLVMILGGLAFKLSAVPFHMWTPDIYEGAPTPVTAFLSVVSKTAAFAFVIRLMILIFPSLLLFQTSAGTVVSLIFTLMAVLSMTIGNVAALRQTDMKRMLAYSTIAHVGYMLLGFVILGEAGLGTLLFYLITYLFMNLGAFAVVIHMDTQMGRSDIRAYGGLIQKRPMMTLFFTIFLISLAGLPVTSGFFAKYFMFMAVAKTDISLLWLVIVGVVNSLISVYYYFNVIRETVVSEPSDSVKALSRGQDFFAMVPVSVGLVICLVATIGLGIYAEPGLALTKNAVNQLAASSTFAKAANAEKTVSLLPSN